MGLPLYKSIPLLAVEMIGYLAKPLSENKIRADE